MTSAPTYCAGVYTITPTATATETETPTVTLTSTVTPTGTITATATVTPTVTATATATATPTITPPGFMRVIINEIAWGGTQADGSAGQWIELYNPGAAIDLTGWHLIAADGLPDIALTGIIPANGYFLLERSESSTSVAASQPPGFDPLSALGGESLRLVTATGSVVDTANSNGGPWPVGSGFAPYTSMERRQPYSADSDAAWQNYFGTPFATDRLGNPINGSPGRANSVGAINTPTYTPTATATATRTATRTQTFTPAANMSVLINEIAWSGTIFSSSDEWIELYNPGTVPIDITGWVLATTDNSFSVTLDGVIQAQDYFLLERTDDATISDITADQIYSGSLNDAGRALRLLDGTRIVDTANFVGYASSSNPWPAGNATTHCSMERRGLTIADSDTAWITNDGVHRNGLDGATPANNICGTPKQRNWAYSVTATPSPVKSLTPARTPTKSRTPTPNRATPQPIVINEFLPHARSDWNGDGKIDSGDEFIEITNLGSQPVSLNNYQLDDQNGDSNPYTISGVTLQPGTRLAFFASETGILLGDGGDSVRLYKSGALIDAYTYGVIKQLDRTWCRLPDDRFSPAGKLNWVFGCLPSPSLPNQLAQTETISGNEVPLFCLSSKLPFGVYLAECDRLGLWNWNTSDELPPFLPPYLEGEGDLFIFE